MSMSATEARSLILQNPKAAPAVHLGRTIFRAGGRVFATLQEDTGELAILLPKGKQRMLIERNRELLAPQPGARGEQGWTAVALPVACAADVTVVVKHAVAESLTEKRARPR